MKMFRWSTANAARHDPPLRAEVGAPRQAARSWRSYAIPIIVALALVVLGVVMGVVQNRKEATIRDLPPDARAQLFRQSLTEVRSLCLESYAAAGPVRDHCTAQARFILVFPECGPDCRLAARAVLPHVHPSSSPR
jgi:hypothetical protein